MGPQKKIIGRHILALDGVRGLAIAMVLLHHLRFILNPADHTQLAIIRLFDGGWSGVQLFFVLSGFLITGILLDSKESPNYFSTFYARRFLRIFPLYYAYLLLVFGGLSWYWRTHFGPDPWANINPWWYIFYVQNLRPYSMIADHLLAHLWSLGVEEQFYFVWPVLVLWLRPRTLSTVCLTLIPVALVPRLLWSGISEEVSRYAGTFTLSSVDALAWGALLALAFRNSVWKERLARWAGPAALSSLAVFCALAFRSGSIFIYSPLIQSWGISVLTVFYACLVFWAATGREGVVPRMLRFKPLCYIGQISYGLYVLHPVTLEFLFPHVAGPRTTLPWNLGRIAILFAASVAVASLSWFVFEKPILELKRKFSYRSREPAFKTAQVSS